MRFRYKSAKYNFIEKLVTKSIYNVFVLFHVSVHDKSSCWKFYIIHLSTTYLLVPAIRNYFSFKSLKTIENLIFSSISYCRTQRSYGKSYEKIPQPSKYGQFHAVSTRRPLTWKVQYRLSPSHMLPHSSVNRNQSSSGLERREVFPVASCEWSLLRERERSDDLLHSAMFTFC